jgi:putative flippase GtrA
MARSINVVEPRELLRFIVTGVTATGANLAAVWLARRFASFDVALIAGIAAGVTVSFLLSKMFAFDSKAWDRAGGEATRFLLVYAVGCGFYWAVAMLVGRAGPGFGVTPQLAETGGVLAGAGVMMVTTYLGHRFFTYRTHRRTADSAGGEA